MGSRCLEQKWHLSIHIDFSDDPRTSRRRTKNKKKRKRCTARHTELIYRGIHSFIRGIKNERLARMETGSVCQIDFLDIKRVPRSVVSNCPFSIRNRSRCMTENRHYFTRTTCNSSHLATMNFLQTYLCVHNRRKFF